MRTPPNLALLYQQIWRGEVNLVGWGCRDFFHFQRWQERFPLTALTDNRPALWSTKIAGYPIVSPVQLKKLPPSSHAVIGYFASLWRGNADPYIGDLPLLEPVTLQQMARTVATATEPAGPLKPMSTRQWQALGAKLADILANNDRAPSAFGCLATRHNQALLKSLGAYHWTDCVAGICADLSPYHAPHKNIILAGNGWSAGGAERQMLNLAIGLKAQGWQPHTLSLMNDADAPHYIAQLDAHTITRTQVENEQGASAAQFLQEFLSTQSLAIRLAVWHLPIAFAFRVACAIKFFQRVRPSALIAYLDWPNALAGLGAALAGVPRIVLSGRNYPPDRFPHVFQSNEQHLRDAYRILTHLPQVRLTNNSVAGAKAYAQWIGQPQPPIAYIPNCLTPDFMRDPPALKIRQLKKQLGLQPRHLVILGAFRLVPEKRPQQFLEVIAKLKCQIPDLRVLICGDGPLRGEMQALTQKLRLTKTVRFMGVVAELREIMACADLLLHTATYEGTPNILLEAQAQNLPIVCTSTGGTTDCLAPSLLPYSLPVDDVNGLTAATRKLLTRPALRQKLAKAARHHARTHFSRYNLVSCTINQVTQD